MSKRSIADDPAGEQEHGQTMPTGIITPEQWSQQRERIKQLYLTDNISRKEIPSIMKEVFGFNASVVQYKYQIKKWQLQKTLTPRDKEFIVLKGLQRQQQHGTSTAFWLCGCSIQDTKVSRQRKGILEDNRDNLDPGETPPNIIYWTPPNTPSTALSPNPKSAKRKGKMQMAYRPLCVTCAKCDLDIYGSTNDILNSFNEHMKRNHKSSLPHTSSLRTRELGRPYDIATSEILCYHPPVQTDLKCFKQFGTLALIKSLSALSHLQQKYFETTQIIANNQVLGTLTRVPVRTSEKRLKAIRSGIAFRKLCPNPIAALVSLNSNSAPTETHSGEASESQGESRKVSKRQRIDPDIQEQPTERPHVNSEDFFRSSVQSRSGVDDDAFADRMVEFSPAQYLNRLKLPHGPGLPRTISEICMDEPYNVV